MTRDIGDEIKIYRRNHFSDMRTKTENIILIQDENDSKKYNYKISDFGIGCIVNKENPEINNCELAGCTVT